MASPHHLTICHVHVRHGEEILGLSYLRPSTLLAALERGEVALALIPVGFDLVRKDAKSWTWIANPFLGPPEPQSKLLFILIALICQQPYQFGLRDITEASLSSLMSPRNFNLRQPLSS